MMRPYCFVRPGPLCVLLGTILLAGCSLTPQQDSVPVPKAPPTHDRPAKPGRPPTSLNAYKPIAYSPDGPTVARQLTERYRNIVDGCQGNNLYGPSFLCSGLIARATVRSDAFRPWNPLPGSGGVSFYWMRKDANSKGNWTNQGFILLPEFTAKPYGFYTMHVTCAFPIDGWTSNRNDNRCGSSANYPDISAACYLHNIFTVEAYMAKYAAVGYAQEAICGFATNMSTPNARTNFNTAIALMARLNAFALWNELIIAEWPQNIELALPIEAFYYIAGSDGAQNSRWEQLLFAMQSGRWVPVIRITRPASINDESRFEFLPEDQDPRAPKEAELARQRFTQ